MSDSDGVIGTDVDALGLDVLARLCRFFVELSDDELAALGAVATNDVAGFGASLLGEASFEHLIGSFASNDAADIRADLAQMQSRLDHLRSGGQASTYRPPRPGL